MASRNKKTTMAKLNRETKLRERRLAKQARKDARRLDPGHADPSPLRSPDAGPVDETAGDPVQRG
jgi:hypothetical protein